MLGTALVFALFTLPVTVAPSSGGMASELRLVRVGSGSSISGHAPGEGADNAIGTMLGASILARLAGQVFLRHADDVEDEDPADEIGEGRLVLDRRSGQHSRPARNGRRARPRTRVAIVDQLPLYVEGLVQALSQDDNVAVVAQGRSIDEIVRGLGRGSLDVFIVGLSGHEDSQEVIQRIARDYPAAGVLVVASADDEHSVAAAMRGGARGYLLRDVTALDLMETVRSLANGNSYVSPALAAKLFGPTLRRPPRSAGLDDDRFSVLTPRESEIIPMLARGYSNKEIGRTLGLSEKTIKYHLTHLLKKLGARNRVEVALLASGRLDQEAVSPPVRRLELVPRKRIS